MKFTIIENGKEVICNVITTYLDSKSNKSYVIYTDGTKKENGLEEIYASGFHKEGNNMILDPIETDAEWDMLDKVLSNGEDL